MSNIFPKGDAAKCKATFMKQMKEFGTNYLVTIGLGWLINSLVSSAFVYAIRVPISIISIFQSTMDQYMAEIDAQYQCWERQAEPGELDEVSGPYAKLVEFYWYAASWKDFTIYLYFFFVPVKYGTLIQSFIVLFSMNDWQGWVKEILEAMA